MPVLFTAALVVCVFLFRSLMDYYTPGRTWYVSSIVSSDQIARKFLTICCVRNGLTVP